MKVKIENYLKHVGVLGMKWGVRNRREVSASSVSQQSNDLVVLVKGQTVHHVTVDPKLILKAGGGLYVSYTEKDAEVYRTEYKMFIEVSRNAKKTFEYKMKVMEDIITPTKQKKIDEFINMYRDKKAKDLIVEMGNNKVTASFGLGMGRLLFGHTKEGQSSKAAMKYKELIESKDPKKQQKAFEDFAQFLIWAPQTRQKYFDRLSKLGFTAMYDDFDMSTGLSKEPLIIFDPTKSLSIESKHDL